MKLLVSLYVSVLVPIYSEWISREDLCFLDTAVCNTEYRNRFLDILSRCYCTAVLNDTQKSFNWVILRGLRVTRLKACCWSPVMDAIVQSKRLISLQIDLDTLECHLDQIQMNVSSISVDLFSNSIDEEQLRIVGPVITDLLNVEERGGDASYIAACCPNLKTLSACPRTDILPFLDHCDLDEINNCHLSSLVKREKCEWTYRCDLKRTYEVDETAVCLGEGKYYHVTALQCKREISDDDMDLLILLMPHLTKLTITGNQHPLLLSTTIEKCCNLTELTAFDVMLDPYLQLLQRLSLLRQVKIYLLFNSEVVDKIVSALSQSCPLMEVCTLRNGNVTSVSIMSELFRKCQYLTDFYADNWPLEAVLVLLDKNIEELIVSDMGMLHKFGRGMRKLKIPCLVDSDLLCTMISHNPGLRSIKIDRYWNCCLSAVIPVLVQCCPLLTSFSRRMRDGYGEGVSLVPLGGLHHMKSLSLNCITGLTVEILSATLENKSSSLLSLTLDDCGITSDMVSVIGILCPALTYLDLSENKNIENLAIVKLLHSCTRLEVLSLRGCPGINANIIPSTNSSLTILHVNGTRFSKSDVDGLRFSKRSSPRCIIQ